MGHLTVACRHFSPRPPAGGLIEARSTAEGLDFLGTSVSIGPGMSVSVEVVPLSSTSMTVGPFQSDWASCLPDRVSSSPLDRMMSAATSG
jgi:hypothetical protein